MALRRIADSRNRQRGKDDVIREFGTVYPVPIGLGENVPAASTSALNQLLADTMVLRDLYKKHHWQVFPAKPSISSTCSSISTTPSRSS
jgi:hypothetical protein